MSTKKFSKDRARLHKAAEIAVGNSAKKSVLILFTDDKSYSVIYSGRKMNIDLQTQMQHDQNIMHILLDNDEAFQIIERIFTPVQRYRRRQQKK